MRDLSDEDAYMQLVLCNTQSELHPLEEGIHALNSGLSGSEYARKIGRRAGRFYCAVARCYRTNT